VFCQLILVLRH